MNGYKIVLLKAIFMLYRLPESERVCSGICKLKPIGDESSQERKPFSGWKVKIEYEATDSDGQPYRSEYWFIMDKEAQCVIRSFEIPLL